MVFIFVVEFNDGRAVAAAELVVVRCDEGGRRVVVVSKSFGYGFDGGDFATF